MVPKINRDRLFTRVRELCAINAPSRHEEPVVEYLRNFWQGYKDAGLSWETLATTNPSEPPNVIMRLEGTGIPLLLSAHMDTVPLLSKAVNLIDSEGILRTDGSSILGSDDRAGIALALEMIDLCFESMEHPSLEVVFTVQEELGCIGSACLVRSNFRSLMALNLDGETPVGTAIVSAPYKGRFTITVNGISAHAALEPQEGRNAIRLAAELLLKLPQGQIDPVSTANIGTISGGRQTNVVCDLVTITGEVRSFSNELFAHHRTTISNLIMTQQVPEGCSVEIEWEDVYAGYTIEDDTAIVRRFTSACEESGYEPQLLRSAGGGDANKLNSIGLPTIVFGMGMHHIHTTKEFLVWKEFSCAADLLARAVFRIPTDGNNAFGLS
jgi:tripeptide aminopeptidase